MTGKLVAIADTPLNDIWSEVKSVTCEEGGAWLLAEHYDRTRKIHSAKMHDGREWDTINGWRARNKFEGPEPQYPEGRGEVRPITVVVATPCHGEVKTGMAWSVANAMAHFLMVPYEAELRCAWEIMKGSNLAQQRQQLVSRAMQLQATHILFWDSDIKAPADLIPRMLNHSKAIVCTNYPTKELVSRPTVYVDGDERTGPLWTKPGDTSLVGDVARAGFGLILIDIETFYRIELPFFHFEPRAPEFIQIGGEDHYFCDKVRAVGIPIFCDQALSNELSHIGDFEYTNEWAVRAEEARQAIYNGEYDEETPEPRKRNWTAEENATFKDALAATVAKREAALDA